MLQTKTEEPCQIPGLAGTVPQRVCEVQEFINVIETFDSQKKKEFKENYEEKYNYRTHNFFLYGGPGRGKTTACKQLKQELNAEVRMYNASEIINSHDLIKEIYQDAEKTVKKTERPVVIIVDNIELFAKVGEISESDPGGRRSFDIQHEAIGVATEMVTQLAKHENNPYIINIFITDLNDNSKIFHPITNRFYGGLIRWDKPDYSDRVEIISHYAQQHGQSIPSWLISIMTYTSEGATGKDIEKIFNTNMGRIQQCCYLLKKNHDITNCIKVITSLAITCLGVRYAIKYHKHHHHNQNN